MRLSIPVGIAIVLQLISAAVRCQVKLPQMVRDSMVLQRDIPLNIWGWASPGEKISIHFNGRKYAVKAGAGGNWLVKMKPMKAGGPFTMTITGRNNIALKDILIGDVWFCSGQSNMVHQLNVHDVTYAKDIAEANDPQIRQFWVPTLTSLQGPQNNLPTGYWKLAVGEDVRSFSAVAYFFAKRIHEKYKVPVGIINASVGGTPIEAWISEEGLKDFSAVTATLEKNKDTAYVNGFSRRQIANAPRPGSSTDRGLTGNIKWYNESLVPKGWRNIAVPGYWEDQGVRDLNGVVWYRKEIDVPASMTGKPARIFLGRIVDADEVYLNGKLIGSTGYQYPQRRYRIAADVLRPGKNVLVVRVTNNSGKGGFVPDKPYCLFAGTDSIYLEGYWQYKVGDVFSPRAGALSGGGWSLQNQPAALYNAMTAPFIQYNIKGILWYQGEANAAKPQEYGPLQQALIADWRNKWQEGDIPFLYVQLPNFLEVNYLPEESNWAALREAQLKALSVPNTAMAVAIDLGEWNDIHPDRKKEVGDRLALAAEKIAYGEDVVYSGPVFQSFKIEGNKISIAFSHTGSGLITTDGEDPAQFAIAGADKKFIWAEARIEGNKVIVWNDALANPLYVRYAWADNPGNPNLANKEGLPASPFRTDQ